MKAPANKPKELIPAKLHKARCYCVCDLGTHVVEYPGSPPKDVRKIMLSWELPECRMQFETEGGEKVDKPRVISQEYTFSCFEKANLAIHVTSWMGACPDDFDFESLLMEPCLLTVVHKTSKKGNEFAKIASVTGLMDDMTVPELENDVIYYYLIDHGKELPQSITGNPRLKWLAEKIADSNEWKRMERAGNALGALGLNQGQADAHEEAAPIEDTTDYSDPEQFTPDGDPIPF